MDDDTKRLLVEAAKRTPPILFRAFRTQGRPSGGYEGLNTVNAITPRAFFNGKCEESKTIYDLTKKELSRMCDRHLNTEKYSHFYTEFSSWAADIQVAFRFARNGGPDVFISVIDTQLLPERITIIHVPALEPILHYSDYDWEYLAHGVIKGPAYKAVPIKAMLDIGISLHYDLRTPTPSSSVVEVISTTEIENVVTVAKQYGTKFGAAVMVAILCLKQRDRNLWRDGTCGVERRLNEYMLAAGFEISDHFLTTRNVYTFSYGGLAQMIRMLRAIVALRKTLIEGIEEIDGSHTRATESKAQIMAQQARMKKRREKVRGRL